MAFQLDPGIHPDAIIELLLSTSAKTDAGQVLNPQRFIEAVKGRARTESSPQPNASEP
jgi:hypothetical protein